MEHEIHMPEWKHKVIALFLLKMKFPLFNQEIVFYMGNCGRGWLARKAFLK